MVDHRNCLILAPSLLMLAEDYPLLDSQFTNKLNRIYAEGERAYQDGDYDERAIDADFNVACDQCGMEIEFLMFKCLQCLSLTLCESCHQQQSP